MSLTETRPTVTVPEWLAVQEMDRLRHIAEQATRTHDQFAYELGFERVRIETITAGDVVRHGNEWWTVCAVQQYVDPPGEWFRVTLFSGVTQRTEAWDAGTFVSRRLDQLEEAF